MEGLKEEEEEEEVKKDEKEEVEEEEERKKEVEEEETSWVLGEAPHMKCPWAAPLGPSSHALFPETGAPQRGHCGRQRVGPQQEAGGPVAGGGGPLAALPCPSVDSAVPSAGPTALAAASDGPTGRPEHLRARTWLALYRQRR